MKNKRILGESASQNSIKLSELISSREVKEMQTRKKNNQKTHFFAWPESHFVRYYRPNADVVQHTDILVGSFWILKPLTVFSVFSIISKNMADKLLRNNNKKCKFNYCTSPMCWTLGYSSNMWQSKMQCDTKCKCEL